MTALPIIERELRAQSRLAFTYILRVLGAAALLLIWLYYGFNPHFPPQLGGRLFGYLNCTLFISIWIAVPLLSADCISRERREGTLGLLFLTPLRPREIVLAKGLVHGLRALSLWLATLPILTIPILLGGVSWKEAALSVMNNFSSICWALAAGLIGSSLAKTRVRAQLFACLLGCGLLLLFAYLVGLDLLISTVRKGQASAAGGQAMSLAMMHSRSLVVGVFAATDFQGWWGIYLGTLTKAGQHAWLLADGVLVLVSVLVLLAAVAVAAWNLQRFWQETPPSASQLWVEEKFCTPILWVSFFHRWMRHKLEKNPIGWLETRTWSGRLVTWGWFALMITLYSEALGKSNSTLWGEVQTFMTCLLMGVMAVSAAGSFQRERETGVLELLLVSPLSVGQIIGGRLRGLWGQFLPAFAVLLGVWMFVAGLYPQFIMNWEIIPFYCSSFLTLPVIGLYCSLRRRSFISAFLFTVFLGFVVPFGLQLVVNWFMGDILGIRFEGYTNGFKSRVVIYGSPGGPQMFAPTPTNSLGEGLLRLTHSPWILILVQGLVAWRVGRLLYRDMERRNFPLSRTNA